mmetsp:Transcript_25226/g.51450  ORF Transcript_25226/g.51450 Transcript_25226/m.51450 type:complete len:613 (-) Transcript_25226:72-1910(-)
MLHRRRRLAREQKRLRLLQRQGRGPHLGFEFQSPPVQLVRERSALVRSRVRGQPLRHQLRDRIGRLRKSLRQSEMPADRTEGDGSGRGNDDGGVLRLGQQGLVVPGPVHIRRHRGRSRPGVLREPPGRRRIAQFRRGGLQRRPGVRGHVRAVQAAVQPCRRHHLGPRSLRCGPGGVDQRLGVQGGGTARSGLEGIEGRVRGEGGGGRGRRGGEEPQSQSQREGRQGSQDRGGRRSGTGRRRRSPPLPQGGIRRLLRQRRADGAGNRACVRFHHHGVLGAASAVLPEDIQNRQGDVRLRMLWGHHPGPLLPPLWQDRLLPGDEGTGREGRLHRQKLRRRPRFLHRPRLRLLRLRRGHGLARRRLPSAPSRKHRLLLDRSGHHGRVHVHPLPLHHQAQLHQGRIHPADHGLLLRHIHGLHHPPPDLQGRIHNDHRGDQRRPSQGRSQLLRKLPARSRLSGRRSPPDAPHRSPDRRLPGRIVPVGTRRHRPAGPPPQLRGTVRRGQAPHRPRWGRDGGQPVQHLPPRFQDPAVPAVPGASVQRGVLPPDRRGLCGGTPDGEHGRLRHGDGPTGSAVPGPLLPGDGSVPGVEEGGDGRVVERSQGGAGRGRDGIRG